MRARDGTAWGWVRAALASCVLLLSGCTLSDSLQHNEFFSVWSEPATTQPMFFVTDRDAEGKVLAQHWGASLHCGRMEVPVPSGPYVANFETDFTPCESPAALKTFVDQVAAASRQRNCNGVLLFVHGYNTTFRSALLRSGQVAHDLQWPCATLLFSWSSEGQFDRYVADAERSGYAVPPLIQLLRQLGAEKLTINILAHSMGTRITLSALGGLCAEGAAPVYQLVLAAPDVGAEAGNDDFGHLLARDKTCIGRTTIYASENDRALMISESVHGGIPRAGRLPLQDRQYLGSEFGHVDLVDASLAPGDPAGHGYFALSYEMVDDMMWVMAGRAIESRAASGGPGERTLDCRDSAAVDCSGGHYVLLVSEERRPDAVSRLARRLLALIYTIR